MIPSFLSSRLAKTPQYVDITPIGKTHDPLVNIHWDYRISLEPAVNARNDGKKR
jgi:hypothetical protein